MGGAIHGSILFVLLALAAAAAAAETTSGSSTASSVNADSSSAAAATSSTDTSPPYTITALAAVQSQAPCVFNCLIPIGLADPSGCDDVSENCACLSAPGDVLDVLTDCAKTVCKSSTDEYAASATSLYESYCDRIYGTMSFSEAFVAESSAAAASSTAATGTPSNSNGGESVVMSTHTVTASATTASKTSSAGRTTLQ